jgi:hypothetical protein
MCSASPGHVRALTRTVGPSGAPVTPTLLACLRLKSIYTSTRCTLVRCATVLQKQLAGPVQSANDRRRGSRFHLDLGLPHPRHINARNARTVAFYRMTDTLRTTLSPVEYMLPLPHIDRPRHGISKHIHSTGFEPLMRQRITKLSVTSGRGNNSTVSEPLKRPTRLVWVVFVRDISMGTELQLIVVSGPVIRPTTPKLSRTMSPNHPMLLLMALAWHRTGSRSRLRRCQSFQGVHSLYDVRSLGYSATPGAEGVGGLSSERSA